MRDYGQEGFTTSSFGRGRGPRFRVNHGECIMSGVKSLASGLGAAFLLCMVPPAFASTYPHSTDLPAPPGVATGSCTEGTALYSVSTNLQATSNKSFVNVSGTTLTFNQGATGCVEVSFSGEVATAP